ncbi:hypothetical protein M405DRAFT_932061, partial [Rhizopogon salebrosus TDB-379]
MPISNTALTFVVRLGNERFTYTTMSSAIMEFVEIFDGEGAFIFVQRASRSKPEFEVITSAQIKASGSLYAGRNTANVLLAMDELYNNGPQLTRIIESIANDMTVSVVFAESVNLAEYLAVEASKIVYAPFQSHAGRLLEEIARKNI